LSLAIIAWVYCNALHFHSSFRRSIKNLTALITQFILVNSRMKGIWQHGFTFFFSRFSVRVKDKTVIFSRHFFKEIWTFFIFAIWISHFKKYFYCLRFAMLWRRRRRQRRRFGFKKWNFCIKYLLVCQFSSRYFPNI